MSILLMLCILAAAGWLVLSVVGHGPTNDPGDTVAEHARAMAALNPTQQRGRRQRNPAPAGRATRSSAARSRRPARHRTAARPRPSAARTRAVRR